MRITAPDRERAQHEAGHCVVARMFNVPEFRFRYTTIATNASGESGGTFNLDFDIATIDQWGVMLMAGVAAQMRGILLRSKLEEGDPRIDEEFARVWPQGQQDREVLFQRGGQKNRIQDYLDQALIMVREGWKLVETISFDLLNSEHHTLYLDEFEMLAMACEKGGDPSLLFDPYRKHRQRRDFTGKKWFDNFRRNFPELPWFEGVHEFLTREFNPEKEEPGVWYERLMGHPYEDESRPE